MDSSDSEASTIKKPFKCTKPNCCASFSRKDKLVIHLRRHAGDRPFVCDEAGCNKTYTNNSHLRRHKNVSHGVKPTQGIICPHEGCGITLANNCSFKKHCNRKHNPDNYPFKCNECQQGFHRKRHLQQHVYLHTGEAAFNCKKCDLTFTTSHNLTKHQREHRTYTCECGREFHWWSLLRTHRKSCRNPTFRCEVCSKTFYHFGNFKSHKLTHKADSEKLVFVCPFEQCKRFYFYKRNLKAHIVSFHNKDKIQQTFQCTYQNCKVVLKTKVLQRRHLKRHFQWKKKRQIRHDAGKPKKTIAAALIGEDLIEEEIKNTDETTTVNHPPTLEKQINTNHDVIDQEDPLLAKCDFVLKLLHEKMIAAK